MTFLPDNYEQPASWGNYLKFKKWDQINVSQYAVGKLLLATNEWEKCIRVFER